MLTQKYPLRLFNLRPSRSELDLEKIAAAAFTGMPMEEFKPKGIHLIIGRRPFAAFWNSTGDKQMLEYTKAGDGTRLAMLVCTTTQSDNMRMARLRDCPTRKSGRSRRRSMTGR